MSQPIQVDAPVAGWDAFNTLDNMAPNAASVLDNLIPRAGSVETRKGHAEWFDTGTGLPVETTATLREGSTHKLLVVSNGGVWEVTNDDESTLRNLAVAGTYSNSRFQVSTFRKFDETTCMILTNGEDTTQIYQFNSVAGDYELNDIVDTGYTAPDSSTIPSAEGDGYGSAAFIGSVVFKGRVFYWKDDDDSIYYAQAGSYQGEITRFELGTVIRKGGKVVWAIGWTQSDSGDGKDDFLAIGYSTGEILVYQGDDPDPGGFFELIGKFYTSEPLGPRGVMNLGNDAVVMTRDGYINLSTVIQDGRVTDYTQFGKPIYRAVVDRTRTGFGRFGWECLLYPSDGLAIFNVPLTFASYEQHVLNITTGAWCRFRDLNMLCMVFHADELVGGGVQGKVYRLLVGTNDDGRAIQYTALTAYNDFGEPGKNKHVVAAQILSTHEDPDEINLRAYANYEQPVIQRLTPTDFSPDEGVWADAPPSPPSAKGSEWADSVDSDKGSFWSSGLQRPTTVGWQNVSAYGFAVALLVQFARVNEGVTWRATGLRYYVAGAQ